jgi:hypothetical protein
VCWQGFLIPLVHCAHRQCYLEEMQRTGGSLLRHPCATRWSSQHNMLKSVVENRVTIENTLSRLRRERCTDDDFKSLAWVFFFCTVSSNYWSPLSGVAGLNLG